jgi:hypothetical protein
LEDLLETFRSNGWKLVDAGHAFADPIFAEAPLIVPAGEGILWGLAKASGKCEDLLRYPAESDVYEKPAMDALGL